MTDDIDKIAQGIADEVATLCEWPTMRAALVEAARRGLLTYAKPDTREQMIFREARKMVAAHCFDPDEYAAIMSGKRDNNVDVQRTSLAICRGYELGGGLKSHD